MAVETSARLYPNGDTPVDHDAATGSTSGQPAGAFATPAWHANASWNRHVTGDDTAVMVYVSPVIAAVTARHASDASGR
jgi:hypothetical protein